MSGTATWLSHAPAWLRAWRERGPGTTVDHISLGTFCHAAAGLRDAGLRRWSGPFDWIFSTPAMAAACLDDDFRTFLDPAQLESVAAADLTHGAKRQCRHPAFESRYGLPIIFNHHDPAGSVIDHQRLSRSVARFRAALQPGRKAVFYLASERRWPAGEIEALHRTLARFPAATRLVVVTITAGPGERRFAIAPAPDPAGSIVDVTVTTRTRSLGAAFPDPADNLHLASVLKEVASHVVNTFDGDV